MLEFSIILVTVVMLCMAYHLIDPHPERRLVAYVKRHTLLLPDPTKQMIRDALTTTILEGNKPTLRTLIRILSGVLRYIQIVGKSGYYPYAIAVDKFHSIILTYSVTLRDVKTNKIFTIDFMLDWNIGGSVDEGIVYRYKVINTDDRYDEMIRSNCYIWSSTNFWHILRDKPNQYLSEIIARITWTTYSVEVVPKPAE